MDHDLYGKLAEDAVIDVVVLRRATVGADFDPDTKSTALVDRHVDRFIYAR